MKNTLILFLLFSNLLIAQDPVLVSDFYEGTDDGFSDEIEHNKSVQIGDKFFLSVITEESGEELGIIENNEIKVIKDIFPGSESSKPRNLTAFMDMLYFTAKDESGDAGLWVTDGTEEGTSLVFKENGSNYRPKGLIVSKSNILYYTYELNLYSYDGVENIMLREGVSFTDDFATASKLYCLYGDEIAFLEESGPFGDNIQLVIRKDGEFEEIGEIEDPAFFSKPFGLSQVSNGLVFGVGGTDDESGNYIYKEGVSGISKFETDGSTDPFDRIENVSDSISVGLFREKGYYAINGREDEEFLIRETTEVSTTQGEGFANASYGNKFIIHLPEGGFFDGSNNIIFSDGTAEGTKVLLEISEYNSNLTTYNQFAYIAKDISNGFEPFLYEINMDDGTFRLLYEFQERSLNFNSIYILGVVNNNLYYVSNLDPEVGRELYYLPIGSPSITSTLENNNIDVRIEGNMLTIQSSDTPSAAVQIFSLDGRLIKSMDLRTNTHHDFSHYKGGLIVNVIMNGQRGSYKFMNLAP